MKKDSRQRLFEVMKRVAPDFTGKALNEEVLSTQDKQIEQEKNKDYLPITAPAGSPDDKLFTDIVSKGIDSHLEGFTKSKFEIKNSSLGNRRVFNFHRSEIPILLRRLEELGTPEALQWKEDIEKYQDTPVFSEGWGRNLAAGAMMGAASLMPMKANAQSQNVPTNNKPGTEMSQDNSKETSSYMIGVANQFASSAMQSGNIDDAGVFKEIGKFYQNVRDGKTTTPLSTTAQQYVQKLKKDSKTMDSNTLQKYIQAGSQTQRSNYN